MITGMQHVGVCISNLEQSLAFYCNELGLKKVAQFEVPAGGEVAEKILGLPGAQLRVAMVQHGEGSEATVVELIQFLAPPGGKPFPSDFQYHNLGITHIAFKVKGIERMYQELAAKGVKFNSPPVSVETQELGTIKAAYFKDPDGITLELMEY